MIVATFLGSLVLFTLVGIGSALHRQRTTADYLLAGRSVVPWLAGLSAVATNNSGFMFVGLVGFAYRFGLQAVWFQVAWVLGDLVSWYLVHPGVRRVSGRLRVLSVPAFVATGEDGRRALLTMIVTGLLTVFFLGGYAAAQLRAGSTALTALFGWHPDVGALLGAGIVLAYSVAGGLRASIWTDAAQSMVMMVAMAVLLGACLAHAPAPWHLPGALAAVETSLGQWIPDDLRLGFLLYLLGFVFGGIGAIGQPHILVRSMCIRSVDDVPAARRVYFLWYVPFSVLAVGVGLYSRLLVPDLMAGLPAAEAGLAAERAMPELVRHYLPGALAGIALAGLFAATMSTADSQILSCSAAITQDIAPRWRHSYLASRMATVAVTGLALAIALTADDNVFALVLNAWAALGATIGPLVILRVFGRVPPPGVAAVMMAAGLATVLGWERSVLADAAFKLLPGIVVPLLVYAATRTWASSRRVAG